MSSHHRYPQLTITPGTLCVVLKRLRGGLVRRGLRAGDQKCRHQLLYRVSIVHVINIKHGNVTVVMLSYS